MTLDRGESHKVITLDPDDAIDPAVVDEIVRSHGREPHTVVAILQFQSVRREVREGRRFGPLPCVLCARPWRHAQCLRGPAAESACRAET